ncbi:sensor histidine kinase [Cohnella cellulosilytica]|uniref:Sensor histidine kinase n=1 Tax=Cohnella cellulosilytica TaxID=986710 RepID=A0ABW2FBH8_9BACL
MKLLERSRKVIQPFTNSIRRKLIVLMILITCLPLIAVIIFAITDARNKLEAEIIQSNTSKIETSALFMDDQLEFLDNILFSVMADKDITHYMETSSEEAAASLFMIQNYIFSTLSTLYLPNLNSFDEITLYKKETDKSYALRNGVGHVLLRQSEHRPWNRLGNIKPAYVVGSPEEENFHMYRTFYRFIDHEIRGGVDLFVKWSAFGQVFQSLKTEDKSLILVMDEQGRVVYRPYGSMEPRMDISVIFTGMKSYPDDLFFKSNSHYVFYEKVARGNMYLVKLIPTSLVAESSRGTLSFSIAVGFIVILASVVASVNIANRASAPILKLIRAISLTEETNSDRFIESNRTDEIGLLEQKYGKIIQSRYLLHIEKRTAQLKALQAQINPHFLHNALQSIGAMAIVRNMPEIYRIIQALSQSFRYTMTKGQDLVTLREELEHVENYLRIQEFRFKDRINFKIEMTPGLDRALLPPLTLQPLVENAFEHAFPHKRGSWEIQIEAYLDDERLKIIINDNGTGISELRLDEIRQKLAQEAGKVIDIQESMALTNIHARLKAIFGDNSGLEIESKLAQGTRITLDFPYYSPDKRGDRIEAVSDYRG